MWMFLAGFVCGVFAVYVVFQLTIDGDMNGEDKPDEYGP